MISGDRRLFGIAAEGLAKAFGLVDLTSQVIPFDFTDYYDKQMGGPLCRRFVSFQEPFDPGRIAEAKVFTNRLETELAALSAGGPPRPINLDPGYVAESKLVLASMKNFSHRIYLGQGVYAEITLLYRKGRWEPLGWTFPDYASGRYDAFLTAVRDALRAGGVKGRPARGPARLRQAGREDNSK